ncbi:MAG TPA: DNA replication/repair protein RecF [Acidimicrobiales bacterium]|nr:DNA replication/repair protein RecF [Acidimicrobiales bacterium]
MHLTTLSLLDFRNVVEATVVFDPEGTTLVTGPNGAGKTNLLEAVAYAATLRSFRGAPREAMVRHGQERAVVRAETKVGPRDLTVEAELAVAGRSRALLNRQPVRRRSDLHEALRCTVFSPQDIVIVRGGPADRRAFLDETLEAVDPKAARELEELERVLRQRGALLRDAYRRSPGEVERSLDVWDQRLEETGTRVVEAREQLVEQLQPRVAALYDDLAGRRFDVRLRYARSWEGALSAGLAAHRQVDLARGVTTVGPHRDELELTVAGLPARTQTSQGEQRSLALALRLAGHRLATERLGEPPLLLLDDVFSELDDGRRRALVAALPAGQALVTSAVPAPPDVAVARVVEVGPGGRIGRAEVQAEAPAEAPPEAQADEPAEAGGDGKEAEGDGKEAEGDGKEAEGDGKEAPR